MGRGQDDPYERLAAATPAFSSSSSSSPSLPFFAESKLHSKRRTECATPLLNFSSSRKLSTRKMCVARGAAGVA